METEKTYWSKWKFADWGNFNGKRRWCLDLFYKSGIIEQVILIIKNHVFEELFIEDGQLLEEGQFNEVTGEKDGRLESILSQR